ncbi:MAG TPA: hypothetical protein VI299_00925 [Polyangiales bacterium]
MIRCSLALGAMLAAAIWGRAAAADDFAPTDACDELALARAADRAGDQALAGYLQADRYRALLAIRASAHAHAPELLIPALAVHACGRDPVLAPEAAHSLRKLAVRLSPSELAAREVLRSDLARAHDALACASAQPPPRADIVEALQLLTSALAQ